MGEKAKGSKIPNHDVKRVLKGVVEINMSWNLFEKMGVFYLLCLLCWGVQVRRRGRTAIGGSPSYLGSLLLGAKAEQQQPQNLTKARKQR